MEIQPSYSLYIHNQLGIAPRPSRLDSAAETIAREHLNNTKSDKELEPPSRILPPENNLPAPANMYAQILVEVEEQTQKELRLKQGPAVLEQRVTPLKETPLVDELYQLFLKNKHIEHPEINEEREVYSQEVSGAEGAQGDQAMAPQIEDLTAVVRNGISIDGLPSMYSNNPDASFGNTLRGDDLYREILDNIHLEERILRPMMPPPEPPEVKGLMEKGLQTNHSELSFAKEYGIEVEKVNEYKENVDPIDTINSEIGGESRQGLLSAKMVLGGNPNVEAA